MSDACRLDLFLGGRQYIRVIADSAPDPVETVDDEPLLSPGILHPKTPGRDRGRTCSSALAARHGQSSPETKRRYPLGMADQVRKAVEIANTRLYDGHAKCNTLRRPCKR